jgi:hypothetical protein
MAGPKPPAIQKGYFKSEDAVSLDDCRDVVVRHNVWQSRGQEDRECAWPMLPEAINAGILAMLWKPSELV